MFRALSSRAPLWISLVGAMVGLTTVVGCSSSSPGPDAGDSATPPGRDAAPVMEPDAAGPDLAAGSGPDFAGPDARNRDNGGRDAGSAGDGGGADGGAGLADASPAPDATVASGDAVSGSSAAQLATKLGKPARLLIGLGGTDQQDITSQGIKPDVHERYLVGIGSGSWPEWNQPSGAYVDTVVAKEADQLGAVPMFTLYQMASLGDGNLSGLTDKSFMTSYWQQAKLLFQRLAIYGKPALVNVEPDFWGYVLLQGPAGDQTTLSAQVTVASDCADLPNTVAGFGHCMLRLARTYAPKALLGFPPSDWMVDATHDPVDILKKAGILDADFVVMQTLDRDAGCFEAASESECQGRSGSGWYWDESNATHPNFQDHLAEASKYHTAFSKPVVWWQTPLGVPSATAGGTSKHYRDNRVHYFLTHPQELVAAGGLAVVFSAGADHQTDITTDGGQFKTLSQAYLSSPAPLP